MREIEPWSELLDEARIDERLVGEGFEHAREAQLVPFPAELDPRLEKALVGAGIDELYSHQAAALEAAWQGTTIVTTGTASGKSLCFNLPTLEVLLRDAKARALYLYPTKALAQDQARAIAKLGLGNSVRPAIYDGDTPREARHEIRKKSNLIFTNPDMLHLGILPHHDSWSTLFANLAVVVVDEAHTYRGVFGSHVANVLRRLRRIAAAYGTQPRFLLASATIANPVELAERLTGLEDVSLIERDGSASAGRRIAIWNPPLTDEVLGVRRSPLAEGAELLAALVAGGARTICFARSRKSVELLTRIARDELERIGAGVLRELVMPYRAGYTPAQRREIEAQLVAGELLAVVTTDALELGIDVGALDAAVVVTFPGTIASLRQMWGRAGRRRRGLAVYVAGADALDQFFARHTDDFLDRPVESAILDHESEEIHLAHLLCAAHEGPMTEQDSEFFGPRTLGYLERLEGLGELRRRDGRFVLRARERYPAAEVSLRSASPDSFAIVEVSSGEVIGATEAARAFSTLHPGAIYLHMGRSFHVRELDLDSRRALVEPFDDDWYTQPKRETDTFIERLLDRREALGVTLSFGRVLVTETVLAYQRRRLSDHRELDLTALELPPTRFATQAIWFELDADALSGFPPELLLGSLHAAEHAQIAVLPLLAMCDRWDIGGLSTNAHPQTGGPTIFIHDGHPGGVGITRIAFAHFEELVADAHRLISECSCRDGCPSCVQSPKCGNLNEPLSKGGAAELLGRMLSQSDLAHARAL
ncbi:MAG TPA: DEAD/DEAH box helicase [Solirubrobacteraceae bacterium]|jgi:DEAD/DEAH box helicase domain-containing protein